MPFSHCANAERTPPSTRSRSSGHEAAGGCVAYADPSVARLRRGCWQFVDAEVAQVHRWLWFRRQSARTWRRTARRAFRAQRDAPVVPTGRGFVCSNPTTLRPATGQRRSYPHRLPSPTPDQGPLPFSRERGAVSAPVTCFLESLLRFTRGGEVEASDDSIAHRRAECAEPRSGPTVRVGRAGELPDIRRRRGSPTQEGGGRRGDRGHVSVARTYPRGHRDQ